MRKLNYKKVFLVLYIAILIVVLIYYLINLITLNSLKKANVTITNTFLRTSFNKINNVALKDARTIQNTVARTKKLQSYIEIGSLELPIEGATGYASVNMDLREQPNSNSGIITKFKPGTGFRILKEQDDWWYVETSNFSGWLEHKYCMINLPDVIPSIIYDDTNSYSSLFKSSGKDLPDITGKALYNTKTMNERFGKEQFLMPVLYSVAKKICVAQQLALAEGNCLKIYETYRPYATQMSVASALRELANSDEEVKNGINSSGWSESWFIAQNLSNHQRGIAIDTSLVKIKNYKFKYYGDYYYMEISDYEEYAMPTQMHELSKAAATYSYAVSNKNEETLKKTPFAKTMNDEAKLLQKYCMSAKLSPLASEWWHFEDLETKENTKTNYSTGRYYITECYSKII